MLTNEFTLEDLFVAKVKGAVRKERVELLLKLVRDGEIKIQVAAKYLNMSVEEVEELLQAAE